MRRVLLCSTAVPWPDRPLLGIFHVHQARAIAALGGEMQLFGPAPAVPRWLARAGPRLRGQAERPRRYEVDGVTVRAPRVPFAFPPLIRGRIAERAPGLVLRAGELALRGALDAAIAEFRPDFLLGHGILPFGAAVEGAAARAALPHAFVEHSAEDLLRIRPGSRLAVEATRIARRARRIFVVGPQMQEHAEQLLGWSNVALLPNGALRASAPPPPRPARLEGRRVVLAAAHPYRRKGLEELVAAFARLAGRHPDAELHLVTEPGPSLRASLAEHPGRVVVHRPMEPQELLGLMAWADLFALPSWSEAFGLVYVEALGQGTPVLCSTDSGFWRYARRWIADGQPTPALAVPPRRIDALARMLDTALSDPALLAATARSGQRMVDAWFSWDRNARTLLREMGALVPGTVSTISPCLHGSRVLPTSI
jgi:glycosyltransferase involved in cell wall biosynthesis